MESDDNDFKAPMQVRMPDRAIEPRRAVRGKSKEWKEVATCSSEDQLRSWLTENSGQWAKKKKHRTEEAMKQYMRCKLPGCCAELLVWYHSEGRGQHPVAR